MLPLASAWIIAVVSGLITVYYAYVLTHDTGLVYIFTFGMVSTFGIGNEPFHANLSQCPCTCRVPALALQPDIKQLVLWRVTTRFVRLGSINVS